MQQVPISLTSGSIQISSNAWRLAIHYPSNWRHGPKFFDIWLSCVDGQSTAWRLTETNPALEPQQTADPWMALQDIQATLLNDCPCFQIDGIHPDFFYSFTLTQDNKVLLQSFNREQVRQAQREMEYQHLETLSEAELDALFAPESPPKKSQCDTFDSEKSLSYEYMMQLIDQDEQEQARINREQEAIERRQRSIPNPSSSSVSSQAAGGIIDADDW